MSGETEWWMLFIWSWIKSVNVVRGGDSMWLSCQAGDKLDNTPVGATLMWSMPRCKHCSTKKKKIHIKMSKLVFFLPAYITPQNSVLSRPAHRLRARRHRAVFVNRRAHAHAWVPLLHASAVTLLLSNMAVLGKEEKCWIVLVYYAKSSRHG